MTAFLSNSYGSYRFESPESRALSTITPEEYAKTYDDAGKFFGKIVGDVSYMGAYMRKMQRGIDEANQNFIQQIFSMIQDVITILGGQGDTGFDFGDLRYVISAIGALFGFGDGQGGISLPINLFSAAWHFISSFIFPLQDFKGGINELIDAFIATILDIFGEIPILGQALHQFAEILSELRDMFGPLLDAIQTLFDAFDIDFNNTDGIAGLFGPFAPIVQALIDALDGITLPDFTPMFHALAQLLEPFIQLMVDVITALAPLISTVIDIGQGVLQTIANMITPVIQVITPILQLITPVIQALSPILDILVYIVTVFADILEFFINPLGGLFGIFTDLFGFLGLGPGSGLGTGDVTPNPLEEIPILGPLLGMIGNIPIIGPIVTEIENFILSLFGGGGVGSIFDLLLSPFTTILNFLFGWLSPAGVLTTSSQIPGHLYGALAPGADTNLLPDPDFSDPKYFNGNNIWSWESAAPYATGAAKVNGEGVFRQLLGVPIPAQPGTTVVAGGSIKWQNVAASGTAFKIGVNAYDSSDNLIANLTNASTTVSNPIPTHDWQAFTGNFTIPAGAAYGRIFFEVEASVTAGSVSFTKAMYDPPERIDSGLLGNILNIPLIGPLVETITGFFSDLPFLGTFFQDLFRFLGNPLGLGSGDGGIVGFLEDIPILGPIISFVGNLIDGIFGGLFGIFGGRHSSADVANAMSALTAKTDATYALTQANTDHIALQALNNPNFHAVDRTLNGVFNLSSLNGSIADTLAVSTSKTVMGFVHIPTNAIKSTIAWLGHGRNNISEMKLNLYSVDTGTGRLDKVWGSDNVIDHVGSELSWLYVPMPAINVQQGDVYGIELATKGSGSHTMVGMPNHWLVQNPNTYPSQLAAERTDHLTAPHFGTQGTRGHYWNTGNKASPTTVQGSHTKGANDNYALMFVAIELQGTNNNWTYVTMAAYFGGQPMTLVGYVPYYNYLNVFAWGALFELYNPPANAQTTQLTITHPSVSGTTVIDFQTETYSGVTGRGSFLSSSGQSAAMSLGAGNTDYSYLVVNAFMTMQATYDIGYYYNAQRTLVQHASTQYAYIIGDQLGSESLIFTGDNGNANNVWCGMGLALEGDWSDVDAIDPVTYSKDVPFLALSSLTEGTVGTNTPVQTPFYGAGTYYYHVPIWSNLVDLIVLGGGGGGAGYTPGNPGYGRGHGGYAGSFNGRTIQRSVDFRDDEDTVLTIVVGAGGDRNGYSGYNTVIYWTTPAGGTGSITGVAGIGGSGLGWTDGQAAGNYEFDTRLYYGGSGNGDAPGSGGYGGNKSGLTPLGTPAQPGAAGAGWIAAKQT